MFDFCTTIEQSKDRIPTNSSDANNSSEANKSRDTMKQHKQKRRDYITTGPSAAQETAGTAGDTNSSKGARNNRNINSRRHVNNRRDAVKSSDGHDIWVFKAVALASRIHGSGS
jgi:hypothetical protein